MSAILLFLPGMSGKLSPVPMTERLQGVSSVGGASIDTLHHWLFSYLMKPFCLSIIAPLVSAQDMVRWEMFFARVGLRVSESKAEPMLAGTAERFSKYLGWRNPKLRIS